MQADIAQACVKQHFANCPPHTLLVKRGLEHRCLQQEEGDYRIIVSSWQGYLHELIQHVIPHKMWGDWNEDHDRNVLHSLERAFRRKVRRLIEES